MAIVLKVNGTDKSNQVDWRSIEKTEVLTKEADTLTFQIKNFGTKTYRPVLGDEITLFDGATKIFGGYIVELNEGVVGLAKFLEVVVKDYTQTLDRNLVSKTYTNQTANAIIADIISTFTTGFTGTNVNAAVTIPKVVFNYLPASQCLQKLADILGNYDWYVDYDKDIHFFNNALIPSPFNLSDTSGNYVFGSLKVHDETHQIRNEIIIRGGEYVSASTRTEYLNGDGTRLIFPLATKFDSLPTITVGGVAKTVGVDFLQADASYQVMWNFEQKSLRFTAGNTPASGTNNIVVTGYPRIPLIFRKQNQASIALYGIYQHLIVDKTIKSVDAASQRADAEILKYANPAKTASFMTDTSGLMAGQTITVASTIRSISQNYKIQSIKTTLKSPTALQFDVQLVTADDMGIYDILNKLLVKDVSSQIDVADNEVVQRYYAFSETIAITDTLHDPVTTSPPYLWGSFTWGFGTWAS